MENCSKPSKNLYAFATVFHLYYVSDYVVFALFRIHFVFWRFRIFVLVLMKSIKPGTRNVDCF